MSVKRLPGLLNQASDREFDSRLPDDLRTRSRLHWTPLAVARLAAQWIDEFGIRSVVDIGSGVGKFCVAAALSSQASYIGLEQRARLVSVARDLAHSFDLGQRVRFIHGTFGSEEVPNAEAYYMYNPFGENLFGPESQIDGDLDVSEDRYQRGITATEQLLADLPLGTFIITYNGFGGDIPPTFRQLRESHRLPNELQLWEKAGTLGFRRTRSSTDTWPNDAA